MIEDCIEKRIEEIVEMVLKRHSVRSSAGVEWPAIMSLETAARYLDRLKEDGTGSRDAMQALIKRHGIPVTKLDSRVQIRKVDLDRLIERKTDTR